MKTGLPFLAAATLGVIFCGHNNIIRRWEGAAPVLLYLVFIGKLFGIV